MFKILLVEDDPHFRKALKEELAESFPSIAIDEASGSEEALEKSDSFRPQLVFMDIRLPGESGLQVTRKIKVKHPEINVVMMTSYDLPEYREAASEYGASHFFVKGTSDANEIRALVKSHLS